MRRLNIWFVIKCYLVVSSLVKILLVFYCHCVQNNLTLVIVGLFAVGLIAAVFAVLFRIFRCLLALMVLSSDLCLFNTVSSKRVNSGLLHIGPIYVFFIILRKIRLIFKAVNYSDSLYLISVFFDIATFLLCFTLFLKKVA